MKIKYVDGTVVDIDENQSPDVITKKNKHLTAEQLALALAAKSDIDNRKAKMQQEQDQLLALIDPEVQENNRYNQQLSDAGLLNVDPSAMTPRQMKLYNHYAKMHAASLSKITPLN